MQVAGYQPFKQAFLQVVQMSSLCRQEQMIFGLCLQIIPLALHFTLTRPPRPFHFQLSTVATMSHMEPGRTATSKPDQSRNSDGSVDDTAIYVKFSSVANQSSSGSAPAWISRVQDYMATVPRVVNIPSFVLTAEPKAATTDSEGMMALDLQHLNPNWGTLLFNRDDGPVHAYYPYAGRAETRSAYIFAGTIIPPHSTQPASSQKGRQALRAVFISPRTANTSKDWFDLVVNASERIGLACLQNKHYHGAKTNFEDCRGSVRLWAINFASYACSIPQKIPSRDINWQYNGNKNTETLEELAAQSHLWSQADWLASSIVVFGQPDNITDSAVNQDSSTH